MSEPLPPSLAGALRPVLPELAEDIMAAIGREVPDYQRPLEGPFGGALRIGVEQALALFVDRIADPDADNEDARAIYVALGRGEMRTGRSLDALLSAYRIGARLAWERFRAAGEAAGHEPATLYQLASAIFEYIDGVSAESIEGFAGERAAVEGERARRRRTLARQLAREGVPAQEIRELARAACWQRPRSLAALLVGDGADEPDTERLASRLGAEALAFADAGLAIAWLPDPDAPGRRIQIEAALAVEPLGPAALGPSVAVEQAPRSLARARSAHALLVEGRLQGDPLVVADEHLPTLLLRAGDATLAAELATSALAPLAPLTPAAGARLRETLRVWLDHPGQVSRVASELHVHPQTVRYRVGQLRELFGERLDDAEARFELALALRAS